MSPRNIAREERDNKPNMGGRVNVRPTVIPTPAIPKPAAPILEFPVFEIPALVSQPPDSPASTIKKWCFGNNVPVFAPNDPNPAFYLNQGNIVIVKQQKPSTSNTLWSEIDYEKSSQVGMGWVTTKVTGWVNGIFLDDYNEGFPKEKFPNEQVNIPHPTENPNDAQQYMYLDADFDSKLDADIKYNMCGELCVAYIVKNDIESVLKKWKDFPTKGYFSYSAKTVKEGTYVQHLKDMLQAHGYIYGGDTDNGDIADLNSGVKGHSLAADSMEAMLKTHYLIARVRSNLPKEGETGRKSGELIAREGVDGNHWVVVDKITRNGSRVELYNPFPNKREEYSFNEFFYSCTAPKLAGLWVKRKPGEIHKEDDSATPKVDAPKLVAIDNPSPEKDAEQYIYIKGDGVKKTQLCGEFSVAYILGKSIDKALEHWKEKQSAKLWELTTILKAYGGYKETAKSFSIETVLAYWNETQPKLYEYHVKNNKPTGTRELRTILRAYGYTNQDDFTDFKAGLKDKSGQYLPSPGRMKEKLVTHFLIAGVGIETVTGKLVNERKAATRHWVVVENIVPTGKHYIDQHFGGSGGWVELYNPFTNILEEYSYREFTNSMSETGLWDGLWVTRAVNPAFVETQEVLFPVIDDAKGDVGGRKPKTNNIVEKWKEKKLLEEIQKRLDNGKSADQIPALLVGASGWSIGEITKLVPKSDKDVSKPVYDVVTKVCANLQVESIPAEIATLIRKTSQGDSIFAVELAYALRDFGILVIGVDKVGAIREFPAPRQAAIASFIDSLSASQQVTPAIGGELTHKVANVIGPVFASQIMNAIENIQAIQAIEKIQAEEAEKLQAAIPKMPVPKPAYRVMWDWEKDDFGGEIQRPNLPSVFRCGELNDHSIGHYVPLTREWQFFWFDLCCKIYYGRYHQDLTKTEYEWLANKWTGVGANTTAFTNKNGLDKFRNYVLDGNREMGDPKIYTLVCGGASLAGTPVPFVKGKKSMWMLKVAHFDGTKPPPPVETIDPYTDPRVFFATSITNKRIKGKYKIVNFKEGANIPNPNGKEFLAGYGVNPFPQFEGKDVPVPLIAASEIYYPLQDLVWIGTGQKPSPYFP